jgi:hypothetical protein
MDKANRQAKGKKVVPNPGGGRAKANGKVRHQASRGRAAAKSKPAKIEALQGRLADCTFDGNTAYAVTFDTLCVAAYVYVWEGTRHGCDGVKWKLEGKALLTDVAIERIAFHMSKHGV